MTQSDVSIYTMVQDITVQDDINRFDLYCQSSLPDLSFRARTKKQYIIGLYLALYDVKLLLESHDRIQDAIIFHQYNCEKLLSYQEFFKGDLYIYSNPDYDPDMSAVME